MNSTKHQFHRSSSMPMQIGRSASANLVDDAEKRINEEIKQLVQDIRRIGTTYPSPAPYVLFGELFDDEFVQQYYEALLGTLKAAKKRGIIRFKGQMLLKGMHDNVVVSIVNESPPSPIDIHNTNSSRKMPFRSSASSVMSTAVTPKDERIDTIVEGESVSGGKEEEQPPESKVTAEASAPLSVSRAENTNEQQNPGETENSFTVSEVSNTPNLSSSSKFTFASPDREQAEQKKQCKQSSNSGKGHGNWRPAPWRQQRPHSTTSASSYRTNPIKKDDKRRLSAPIPDGRSGDGDVDVCSVPEDVALKPPPISSSRGSGNSGLSKAAMAALGGNPSSTKHSATKASAARRFLRSRKNESASVSNNSGYGDGRGKEGDTDSIGGSSTTSFGAASIASAPAHVMRAGDNNYNPSSYHRPTYSQSSSATHLQKIESRLDEEIGQLLIDIKRVGTNPGEPNVAFGELFEDDDVQNYYEALVGTLKSAKRRGVVTFKGQMLLKGMHDNVLIEIVNP
mmetsp:Transcript_31443/g.45848  ORF Transcript_31443/g.45848 Transcript_31443/m.45848 type:complete len:510 (+) Transcript_31443:301-1830(+)